MKQLIAVVGDLHFPFNHKAATSWLYTELEQLFSRKKRRGETRAIVQIGDLYDYFSMSRFPSSPNTIRMTPQQEIELGRECAEEFWRIVQLKAKADYYQIKGNHCNRLSNSLLEKLPELFGIINFDYLFEFPGVETTHDVREELIIDDICFLHGYFSQQTRHVKKNLMHSVYGHSHRSHNQWIKVKKRLCFEHNCGFVGDPDSKVMGYTKQKWNDWTVGYSIIDDGVPRFIPYPGDQ